MANGNTLVERLDIHAEKMSEEGHHTTASVLLAAAGHLSQTSGIRDNRQDTVVRWLRQIIGPNVLLDLEERGDRLLEEALEAAQASGTTREKAHRLVDYVFGRPVGELPQELGGVGLCLLGLAAAIGQSADVLEQREVDRVLSKPIDMFKARHAAKIAAGVAV